MRRLCYFCKVVRLRRHYRLLTSYLRTHQVPHILVEGLVLSLLAKAQLILRDVTWIYHAVASGGADLSEGITPSAFGCRNRSSKQNLEALARQLYDFGLCHLKGEYLWYTIEKVP